MMTTIVNPADRASWLTLGACVAAPAFVGRAAERATLSEWLGADTAHPLFVLRAPGGAGKSALAWHWLCRDVHRLDWPRIVWWNVHAGDTPFDSFLAKTLEYLTGTRPDVARTPSRTQLEMVIDALEEPGTLIVLDGFERALRGFEGLDAAYRGDELRRDECDGRAGRERDCTSPLAASFLRAVVTRPCIRSRVLLTTLVRPAVVETAGERPVARCRDERLEPLEPAAAVELFHLRGVREDPAAIGEMCDRLGGHALSLALVAGRMALDRARSRDAIAALKPDAGGDVHERRRRAFEIAAEALASGPRRLLDCFACLRRPVTADLLATLVAPSSIARDLDDLLARELVQADADKRWFDLHPLVRGFAYERLSAADRARIHAGLCDRLTVTSYPARVRSLDELAPGIEQYHHAIGAGRHDEALELVRDVIEPGISHLLRHGHCSQSSGRQLHADLCVALCPEGTRPSGRARSGRLPALADARNAAWLLESLAVADSFAGQPHRAAASAALALEAADAVGGKRAAFMPALTSVFLVRIGALRRAEATVRHGLARSREIDDEHHEALAHAALGLALAYRGAWDDCRRELAAALPTFERARGLRNQGYVWATRALCEILQLRSTSSCGRMTQPVDRAAAIPMARRALDFADAWTADHYALERDYVHAHWLLGAAHRLAGVREQAECHLQEALTRCRAIDMVDHEAPILVELAQLRLDVASTSPARTDASSGGSAQDFLAEASIITTRSGDVLQRADACLALARLASIRHDVETARAHAADAQRLAACDGPPDYTYRAAYDEATSLLGTLSCSSTT